MKFGNGRNAVILMIVKHLHTCYCIKLHVPCIQPLILYCTSLYIVGHHNTVTGPTTRANEVSLSYDTAVDRQNSSGVEQGSTSAFGTQYKSSGMYVVMVTLCIL